jgi:hypothetical protein
MQHGQHRGRPDACADQQNGCVADAQDERAPRGGSFRHATWPQSGVDELAAQPVRLALDADAVGICARVARQGVAAQQRLRVVTRPQPQGEELARLGGRHWSPARIGQVHGDHRLAFPVDPGDGQLAKSGPGWGRADRGKAGVAPGRASGRGLAEHRLERFLPAVGQRRDPQRPLQLPPGMAGQVEQGIHLSDCHRLWPGYDLHDLVAGRPGTPAMPASWSSLKLAMCLSGGPAAPAYAIPARQVCCPGRSAMPQTRSMTRPQAAR